MSEDPRAKIGLSAEGYMEMVERGLLGPEDRIELLEGLVVAIPPHSPGHASAITRTASALERALAGRAIVRVQLSLLASGRSVPEPDLCVVPGPLDRYDHSHPNSAHLVVEVAASSIAEDRLTKSRIYANAGIPEYWIVNLRDRVIEVYTDPDRAACLYRSTRIARPGERIALVALDDVEVNVDSLLPSAPADY